MDLVERRAFTLHQLVQVLAGERERSATLSSLLVNGARVTGAFAAVLDQFRDVRNVGGL